MTLTDVGAVVFDASDAFNRASVIAIAPLIDLPDPFAPTAPPPAPPSLSGAPSGYTQATSADVAAAGEIGASFTCSFDGAALHPGFVLTASD